MMVEMIGNPVGIHRARDQATRNDIDRNLNERSGIVHREYLCGAFPGRRATTCLPVSATKLLPAIGARSSLSEAPRHHVWYQRGDAHQSVCRDARRRRAAWPSSTADDTRDEENLASHTTPRVIEGVGTAAAPEGSTFGIGAVMHTSLCAETREEGGRCREHSFERDCKGLHRPYRESKVLQQQRRHFRTGFERSTATKVDGVHGNRSACAICLVFSVQLRRL